MPTGNNNSAGELVAELLESNSESIVAEWIDWLRERVPTTTTTALPERALRNHIPPVLLSLASYLRSPSELVRGELLGHLRLHGQIRRDQGYLLKEVLAEFDGLADIVTRKSADTLKDHQDSISVVDALQAFTRLSAGLRSVSFIAMGTYGESDEQRAQSMSLGLEEFARAVTHELRNPLNTLSLSVQLIREMFEPPDDLIAQLDTMDGAVRHAVSLLDTIHVLAIAEEARSGTHLTPLPRAVHKVIAEISEGVTVGRVGLQVEDPLPDVHIETTVVYIVLVNLIGNSIRYADPGKDEQWVKISAQLIEEEHDSGFCEIIVSDNGLGIPAEMQPRVFQKGFRAHPGHALGTGLGLHIVQRVLHDRGGSVVLTSQDGHGTTVAVRTRCLRPDNDSLTTERFRVEHLMGESVWKEFSDAGTG